MASTRIVSDDSSEENGQGDALSQDATQTLYLSDDQGNEMFALGPAVSKRPRIEMESDVPEQHENESEDDKNRNTISACEVSMSQSEDSEPNQRILKKAKKSSIKQRTVRREREGSSDGEQDEIEVSQQSSRTSKLITVKTERAELNKNVKQLEKKIRENKAKGTPPPIENKNITYTSAV